MATRKTKREEDYVVNKAEKVKAALQIAAPQRTGYGKKTCSRCEDAEWPCFLVDDLCRM